MIAFVGWGSLTWWHDGLPINGGWEPDGPLLPVEFVRQSEDGRVTLVISPESEPVRVLWAMASVEGLDEAAEYLRKRERTISGLIGSQYRDKAPLAMAKSHHAVHAWLQGRPVSAAVWTELGPSWNGKKRVATADEVVAYLSRLAGQARSSAEEYVRRAPLQVRTAYRARIEQELGWTPATGV